MKDQKIQTPPLPAALLDVEFHARAHAAEAVELDRQDQHADAFERDHQKAVRAIEVAGIPEIQGLSPENAISTLAFMLDRQQAMPPKEWFDTFMELARDVAVANRAIARDTSTANQKLAAEAAQALQDHARRRLADDRQGRGEPVLDRADLAFILDELREAGLYRAANLVADALHAPQPADPVVKESLTVAEPVKEVSDDEDHIVDLISEYGDHNAEHGRISFDKWTLREAASALLTRYGSKS